MKRMLKIGMDVHSTNYTLCAMEPVSGQRIKTDARCPYDCLMPFLWRISSGIYTDRRGQLREGISVDEG